MLMDMEMDASQVNYSSFSIVTKFLNNENARHYCLKEILNVEAIVCQ